MLGSPSQADESSEKAAICQGQGVLAVSHAAVLLRNVAVPPSMGSCLAVSLGVLARPALAGALGFQAGCTHALARTVCLLSTDLLTRRGLNLGRV